MRCIVLVKADKASESGALPNEQDLAKMSEFNQELANAGVLRAEDEDFGPAFTPELREKEERMRAQVAARK